MLFNGKGMVWDSEKQEVLCRFNARGIFNTDDTRIIQKLEQLGYVGSESTEVVEVVKKAGGKVNWEDKYNAEYNTRLAVERKYLELKEKYEALAETIKAPVKVDTVEEATKQGKEELEQVYVLGKHRIKKEVNEEKISTLRNLLKEYDALQGIPYHKVTKIKAVELTYQLLDKKGLL